MNALLLNINWQTSLAAFSLLDFGDSPFGVYDWSVLAGYFAILAASGLFLSLRKQKDTADYFLAGRSMPAWAVAVSVLATAQSAATFIGAPESAYRGDMTYLSANLGQILAAVIVAIFFIPLLYRAKVSTVYQLLSTRFDQSTTVAASWMFMVGRVFASGARLFMGSLAGSLILFGDTEPSHICVAIGLVTVIGVVYTLAGGIRSVIWTDVLQCIIYVGAAIGALVVLLQKVPASYTDVVEAWSTGLDGSSKLTWLKTSVSDFSLKDKYTLWTALIGFTLMNLGFYGTDQDGIQRMMTCKSAKRGAWSMIGAILVSLPVTALFMLVGLLLWVLYQRPDLMGGQAFDYDVTQSKDIFLRFIMHELPEGLRGLMMAGLIAAGLSSLNSALNAMSSTFISDGYRRWLPDRTEHHYVVVGRFAVAGWGVFVGGFAMFCVFWQRYENIPLIDFSLLVMTFAYAGLVAVFLTALFTRRGNSRSARLALLAGFLTVLVLQKSLWAVLLPDTQSVLDFAYPWKFVNAFVHEILDMAYPWKLTVATALALSVCMLGKPSLKEQSQPS